MGDSVRESAYQAKLINKIESLLPDCFVMRLDPDQRQGIPDILILFENKWAMLEVKLAAGSTLQPNQEYYVELFNDMSFAAFIYPAIEDEILSELVEKLGRS